MPGRLAESLPAGTYRFGTLPEYPRLAALSLALGHHPVGRYRKNNGKELRLVLPAEVDREDLSRTVEAVTLARDLINTPANDLGPAELEQAARRLADRYQARVRCIEGEALLSENLPLIHAVGRASANAPRLIDLSWGDPADPRVSVVGKGVTFDTGGLDLKPESAMLIMKKDMGGAANALALAHLVMDAGLKVRLRVLIPAVENAVSGAAFRPLDVYGSRKGLSVEIGNTDAEGRSILADALALADEEAPELIVDMATLTGAARVALGPDLPAFFTEHEALAAALTSCGTAENDPLWRLPLWRPYASMLDLESCRYQECEHHELCGVDHRRFVFSAICDQRPVLDPHRSLCLDPCGQARTAGGRRVPGRAGALCATQIPHRQRGVVGPHVR